MDFAGFKKSIKKMTERTANIMNENVNIIVSEAVCSMLLMFIKMKVITN